MKLDLLFFWLSALLGGASVSFVLLQLGWDTPQAAFGLELVVLWALLAGAFGLYKKRQFMVVIGQCVSLALLTATVLISTLGGGAVGDWEFALMGLVVGIVLLAVLEGLRDYLRTPYPTAKQST